MPSHAHSSSHQLVGMDLQPMFHITRVFSAIKLHSCRNAKKMSSTVQMKWNCVFCSKAYRSTLSITCPKKGYILYILFSCVCAFSIQWKCCFFLHVSNRIIRLNCIKFYVMANSDTNSQTVQHETVTNISFLANIYFFSSYKHRHQDCHFQGQTKKN